MKTSTGYWASSALAAILNDCLLNPNTYLQNLQVKLSHIYLIQYWVKLSHIFGQTKLHLLASILGQTGSNLYASILGQIKSCHLLQYWVILGSEWLLFNANSDIFQLYHGENKLIFNEMMKRSTLYLTNTPSWIF
jgi:hypothetical protein